MPLPSCVFSLEWCVNTYTHAWLLQVPYGTSFHQNVQWAAKSEGKGKCRLRITGEVEFTKSPFVKGMIQKASEEVCSMDSTQLSITQHHAAHQSSVQATGMLCVLAFPPNCTTSTYGATSFAHHPEVF